MTDEKVTITLGGETIEIPPILNFAGLKRINEPLKAILKIDDPVEMTSAAIRIVSVALRENRADLTPEAIEKKLLISEYPEMLTAGLAVLRASGLIRSKSAGEAQPAGTKTQENNETGA